MKHPLEPGKPAADVHRQSLRVAAIYLLIAALWILFSDQLVARIFSSPDMLLRAQTIKGLGFIGITAIALYFLVRHALRLTLRSAELERKLQYDALTGLPDRELLASMMPPALTLARQRGAGVAVVAIHVDGLRQINENLGIAAGDQVLVTITQRLRGLLGPGDLLARATGNTFIAVVDDPVEAERIRDIARAVLRIVAEPVAAAGAEFRVSASVGISRFPDDHTTATALLTAAEAALAQARTESGWRVRLYSAGMTRASSARFQLENELRRAIDEHTLTLCFQPQVRLADNQAVGIEALLRWDHPELGSVPPATFIPLAEETGLILPMSEWLLEAACTQARSWLDQGLPPLRLAINLSGQQFSYRRLTHNLADLLDRHGLAPAQIELEITEHVTMQDPEHARQVIHELKNIGFGIAIDDFGTGHSSLAYLQYLPADRIKIDSSFLDGIPGDSRSEAICRTIIRLGHDLELVTVAEGIESATQRQILLAAGCDEGQGYLFARPMPALELGHWLRQATARGAS